MQFSIQPEVQKKQLKCRVSAYVNIYDIYSKKYSMEYDQYIYKTGRRISV